MTLGATVAFNATLFTRNQDIKWIESCIVHANTNANSNASTTKHFIIIVFSAFCSTSWAHNTEH